MRLIKAAVIPPKKKRVGRSVYRDKILGFKGSSFERSEVLLDEGESPKNVYQNLKRYAKKLGVLWGRDAKTARSDADILTWTAGACGGAR